MMYKIAKKEKVRESGTAIVEASVFTPGRRKPIVTYTAKDNDLTSARERAVARCQEWIDEKGEE